MMLNKTQLSSQSGLLSFGRDGWTDEGSERERGWRDGGKDRGMEGRRKGGREGGKERGRETRNEIGWRKG